MGQPEVSNAKSKTIEIPVKNIFDGQTLSNLLQSISNREGAM